MKGSDKRSMQKGITMIGFLLGLIVLGFFAYLAMRIVPMYIEYFGVVKAIKHVVAQPDIAHADDHKIRNYLSAEFDIGYVDSITAEKGVKIKRTQDGIELSVDYEVRKPFVSNLELLGHFQKTVSTAAGAANE